MPSVPPINALTRMSATAKDLFTHLYDLSPLDVDILFMLIRNSNNNNKNKKNNDNDNATLTTLDEVSEAVDRDRTTTFRSLQKLVTLGLCIKETKTIKEGGYYHVYGAVDMETFRLETEKRVKDLQRGLDRLLKKFEDDMQKTISSMYEKK